MIARGKKSAPHEDFYYKSSIALKSHISEKKFEILLSLILEFRYLNKLFVYVHLK